MSVLLMALAVTGCNNVFSPSSSQSSGNVTVSLAAGTSARIVLPSTLNFDLYKFKFTNESIGYDETFSEGKSAGGTFTFSIPAGPGYMLNVQAFKNTGEGMILAAEGNSSVFTVGASTPVTVKLTGNLSEGTGTFSYTIQFPAGAQAGRMALVIGEDNEIPLLTGADMTEGQDVYTVSSSVDVQAGWYWLELELASGDKVVLAGDLVSIYSNTTSFYGTAIEPVIFTAEDFKAVVTPPVDGGVPVNEWHGFEILTDPNDGRHAKIWFGSRPANAIATEYSTIDFPNGKTYKDVLKIEAPVGSFEDDVLVIYKTFQSYSTYVFSIDMWIENGPGHLAWEFYNPNWDRLDTFTGVGYWKTVKMTISTGNITNTDFFIGEENWANENTQGHLIFLKGQSGLQGPIYFKDAKVTVNGVIENQSVQNEDTGELVDPGELWLSHKTVTLAPGGTLWVTSSPYSGVEWTSDNPIVASVADYESITVTGRIYAHTVGDTTIRAVHRGRNETNTVTVKVREPESPPRKFLVLTFDDGPGPHTAAVLDALNETGAVGTFFLIGWEIDKLPQIVRRIRAEGHGIGNHTDSHYWEFRFDEWEANEKALSEIQINQNKIASVTSIDQNGNPTEPLIAKYFRAPSANYKRSIVKAALETGLPIIGAGDPTFDWETMSAATIAAETERLARPWGIVTNHDNCNAVSSANLADAIRIFVPKMKALGWEFVTLDEMLAARKVTNWEPGNIYEYFGEMEPEPGFDESAFNVTGVKLSHDNVTLAAGDSKAVIATVLPRIANNLGVIWATSDANIATVANGVITATGAGTASVTATTAEGGKTAALTVNVLGGSPDVMYTTWAAFNWPGWDGYLSSYAEGEVLSDYMPGDGYSYSNVLKLTPPNGGYKNDPDRGYGASAMTFIVPDSGIYTISVDIWVDSDRPDVDLVWVENQNWGSALITNERGVETGAWLHIEGTSANINAGTTICLVAYSGDSSIRLNDAILYFKNMKLELAGAAVHVINIPSTATETNEAKQGITLEWVDNGVQLAAAPGEGDLIRENPLTIRQGGTVTLTVQGIYNSYEWELGRDSVGSDTNSYTFTGTTKGSNTIAVWVKDGNDWKAASIVIWVE